MSKQDLILEKLQIIEDLIRRWDSQERVLDIQEAAEVLKISKSHLYRLTSRSEIPHFKPTGKKIYFSLNELMEWAKSSRVKTVDEIDEETNDYILSGKHKKPDNK